MRGRSIAILFSVIGLAFAAYTEYGTERAADIERSFGWFAYEAGPWAALLALALFSPFVRTVAALGVVLLAFDLFAYYQVFMSPQGSELAVVYLYKPFYGFAVVGVGILAGFLIARSRQRDP
jgi:hypothetical protein